MAVADTAREARISQSRHVSDMVRRRIVDGADARVTIPYVAATDRSETEPPVCVQEWPSDAVPQPPAATVRVQVSAARAAAADAVTTSPPTCRPNGNSLGSWTQIGFQLAVVCSVWTTSVVAESVAAVPSTDPSVSALPWVADSTMPTVQGPAGVQVRTMSQAEGCPNRSV